MLAAGCRGSLAVEGGLGRARGAGASCFLQSWRGLPAKHTEVWNLLAQTTRGRAPSLRSSQRSLAALRAGHVQPTRVCSAGRPLWGLGVALSIPSFPVGPQTPLPSAGRRLSTRMSAETWVSRLLFLGVRWVGPCDLSSGSLHPSLVHLLKDRPARWGG